MEYKDSIRMICKPEELSIIERSKYIVERQYLISNYLNKFDWLLFDKTFINIQYQDQVSQLILNRVKKRIKKATDGIDIDDNYVDTVSTLDGFYASKKFDAGCSLTFSVGTNTESSILIIKKALSIESLNHFEKLKKFIIKLTELFQPKYIEVSEFVFYNDLMNLDSDEYRFGWMTYFSKDIKTPPIPSEIKVEELPSGGKLLITTEETFTTDNPEHVRKAKLLVDLFRKNRIKSSTA